MSDLPPKILNILVSDEAGSERDYDKFINDVKVTLTEIAGCKNVTVLLAKYQVDGEHVLRHKYEAAQEADNE